MELVEWYGSAALMMIPEWHEKCRKWIFKFQTTKSKIQTPNSKLQIPSRTIGIKISN
jgi:hypothetical protein